MLALSLLFLLHSIMLFVTASKKKQLIWLTEEFFLTNITCQTMGRWLTHAIWRILIYSMFRGGDGCDYNCSGYLMVYRESKLPVEVNFVVGI